MRMLALLWLLAAMAAPAAADIEAAKVHFKRGLSFYALGRFPEAAVEYEKAFEVEPDSALLYNAAQAHRLAGNKTRAVLLYQNYLRLFPGVPNRREVERQVAALTVAIEADRRTSTAPPMEPLVSPGLPAKPEPPTPHVVEPARPVAVVVVKQPSTPPARKRSRAWVWGVVGGSVALVAVGLGLGLGLGLSSGGYPSPNIGDARLQ